MQFIADCMLGKLAKWLRIVGYDTLYYRDISAAALLQKALTTRRILLTRDTKLFAQIPAHAGLFITNDHVPAQLRQVIQTLKLDVGQAVLTRCLACNTELHHVEKTEVAPAVPDFIYHTQHKFARCPRCGKIYWQGSHHIRIAERVKQLQSGSNQTTA